MIEVRKKEVCEGRGPLRSNRQSFASIPGLPDGQDRRHLADDIGRDPQTRHPVDYVLDPYGRVAPRNVGDDESGERRTGDEPLQGRTSTLAGSPNLLVQPPWGRFGQPIAGNGRLRWQVLIHGPHKLSDDRSHPQFVERVCHGHGPQLRAVGERKAGKRPGRRTDLILNDRCGQIWTPSEVCKTHWIREIAALRPSLGAVEIQAYIMSRELESSSLLCGPAERRPPPRA